MKKLFFILFLIVFCATAHAQNYSVWITNHSNNSTDPGVVSNPYGSDINFSIGWSGQKSNPNNIWKFKVALDNPPDILLNVIGGTGGWEGNADEFNPTCTVTSAVNRGNSFFVEMCEVDVNGVATQRATTRIFINVPATVYVANDFGAGTVKIGGQNQPCGSTAYVMSSANLNIDDNQVDNAGYSRIWADNSYWNVNNNISSGYYLGSAKSITYQYQDGDNGATITAHTNKLCNLTSNCTLLYGGTYYSPGSSITLVDGTTAQITAVTNFVSPDYLNCQFVSWQDNGSTSATRSVTIYGHESKNVNFNVLSPNNGYRNQNYSGSAGQPITITWSQHPSSLVSGYEIWRSIKDVQSTRKIADISDRGTTTYTDNECNYTLSYTENLIHYDVRAKLNNGVTSSADFIAVYGDFLGNDPNKIRSGISSKVAEVGPSTYTLGSYPNPFNPTTVIRYAMPEAGQVSLKVYNILSQEVANLVDETKSAGIHTVNFNANNLPTGIYIARLQAGSKVISIKLQLVK